MIDVTCAVIRNDEGKVLAVRRGQGMDNAGKWEFPGGKVKPGESDEDCILREIHEELGIDIIIIGKLDNVEHNYSDKAIRLIPFICDTLASKPQLREHEEYRWIVPDKMVTLEMTAADVPVAKQYLMHSKAASYIDSSAVKDTEKAVESIDSEGINEINESPGDPALSEADREMAKYIGGIASTREISMVAHSALTDSVLLAQLVTLSSSHESRVGFMASWALSKVADMEIDILQPFLVSFIEALPDVPNDSVQRSFMRIITKSDVRKIPESHHARLIEYCMKIMQTEQQAIAPKAYGMEILANLAVLYPDMANEVAVAIQMAIAEGSPGIKAQGRKAIAKLTSLRS